VAEGPSPGRKEAVAGREADHSPPTSTLLVIKDLKVFTAVTMKNADFWDVAPCGFIINRRFGETCCLNPQGKETI
jgi:hypothetical protein